MRGLPDDSLVFVPDPGSAPTVVEAPVRIHLSFTEDYFLCDGVYATLYEATVPAGEDAGACERVAFKVFKGKDDETRRLAEEEYAVLRDLNGLGGHVPCAYAFGMAGHGPSDEHGRPTIAQEYLSGPSVLEVTQRDGTDPRSEAHILDVLQKAWAISLASNELVNNGVRHGDLSYTNVLLTRLERPSGHGQRYFAAVIDFGQAAVRRDPDSYDKPGTEFFSAPELLGEGRPFDANRGRASADSYSIGALALYMLLRPSFDGDEAFFDRVQGGERRIREALDGWLSGSAGQDELAEMLALVIRCCMCQEPADRLATSDLVEAFEALCTPELRTPEQLDELRRWLLRRGAAGRYSFARLMERSYRIRPSNKAFGRDAELDLIADRLRQGRVAYVRGFGGIGKTTLALSFAARAMEGQGFPELGVKRTYLISAEDGLAKALADVGSSTILFLEGPEALDADRVWQLAELGLRAMEDGLGNDDLVIVDGLTGAWAGRETTDGMLVERMAQSGAYRLLITTREVPAGSLSGSEVIVHGMDDGSLGRVFAQQLRGVPCESDLLPRLFDAVGRNTLAVKIVGGLIGQSGGMLSLADVLRELESGNLGSDVMDGYEVALDDRHGTDTVRGHMLKLLSLTGFTGEELRLLSMLLLIPASGILLSTLREGIRRYDPALGKAFGQLQSRGWVETMPEEGRVYLHPLVRDVCLESQSVLPPSMTSRKLIEVLYDNARWHLDRGELSYLYDFEAMLAVAEELFDGEIRDSAMARILQQHAEVLHLLGRAGQEVEVLKRLIALLGHLGDAASGFDRSRIVALADALYHLCVAQSDLGRPSEAMQSATRALRLLGWGSGHGTSVRIDDVDDLSLIASLLAMRGYASHDLWADGSHDEWDLTSALIDKEAALKIVRSIGGDSWQVANVLYTLAYTEHCFDDMRDRALADEEEAVALLRSCRHRPNYERELLLATALNFLGYFLCGPDGAYDRGRLEESLERKEEALQIRYRYLDPRHRDIARSHNNIALSLKEMGNLERALDHALLALKIRKGRLVLGARDGDLAHDNILELQSLLGIPDSALAGRFERLQVPSRYVR